MISPLPFLMSLALMLSFTLFVLCEIYFIIFCKWNHRRMIASIPNLPLFHYCLLCFWVAPWLQPSLWVFNICWQQSFLCSWITRYQKRFIYSCLPLHNSCFITCLFGWIGLFFTHFAYNFLPSYAKLIWCDQCLYQILSGKC